MDSIMVFKKRPGLQKKKKKKNLFIPILTVILGLRFLFIVFTFLVAVRPKSVVILEICEISDLWCEAG